MPKATPLPFGRRLRYALARYGYPLPWQSIFWKWPAELWAYHAYYQRNLATHLALMQAVAESDGTLTRDHPAVKRHQIQSCDYCCYHIDGSGENHVTMRRPHRWAA